MAQADQNAMQRLDFPGFMDDLGMLLQHCAQLLDHPAAGHRTWLADGDHHVAGIVFRVVHHGFGVAFPQKRMTSEPSPNATHPPDELTQCLSRIMDYDPVRNSGKLRTLLDFLIRHLHAGDGARMNQFTIAFECFGLRPEFDPGKSSLVRVHLSKLRKLLQQYAAGPGASDSLRIRLPAGSYALEVCVADESHAASRVRRPTIALIEFRGIGLEDEWCLLPVVLSEQLAGSISNAGRFTFMGPFSRRVIGEDDPDIPALAKKHGIDCFIDGHVHRKRDLVELGIRMIDAATGQVTWAASEELPLDRLSLDGIEEELLARLSDVIGADYGGVDAHFSRLARVKPEHSLTVYEAVLLGRMYFSDFNPRALFKAIPKLRQVVQMHPDEPMPKATLAMLLANSGHEPRWPEAPPAEEIKRLARDAWHLAPDDPWAILACGFSACFGGDGHEIRRLAHALEGDANAATISKCGIGILMCLRCIDSELGMRLIHESRRMNPYQPSAVHVVEALVALRRGDLDGAIAHLDIYRIPWGWADPLIRGAVHALRGNIEFAAGEYRTVLTAFPGFEQTALEDGRLIWHREHMEFLIGTFADAGITMNATG